MKKIININLSGRVIPIEDSAYESLQRYIESLRRYFAGEEGRDEIINDIESRIAELMNEKIKKGSTSVTDADIDEIIQSMGRIEDFEEVDAAERNTGASSTGTASSSRAEEIFKKRRGRLYRDSSDKILGGVGSGIANYLEIDPAIVRIILVLFGFTGTGILLYFILWIVLPAKELNDYSGKRLFRNPDDKVIAGVAGGLSAYFNKPVWIIRLILVAPLLFNVIFGTFNGIFFAWNRDIFPNVFVAPFTGTFVLAYIILWMVLPEAKTTYQKMEMRGERVDVNRIRQNVKDEMENLKTRAQAWGQEVSSSAQDLGGKARDFANTRGKTFAGEVSQAAKPVAYGFGHLIGVLFKAFFFFVIGVVALSLFAVLMVLIFGGVAWWPVNNFLWTSGWQKMLAWGTVIFFLAVPVIALITWLIRRVMRVRHRSRNLSWVFGGLWTLGWIMAIMFGISIANDLRSYDKTEPIEVPMSQPANGILHVKVDEPEIRFSNNIWWVHADNTGWDINENEMKYNNVKLRVNKSEDSMYHIRMYKYSAGKSPADAQHRASMIGFNARVQDTVLNLSSGITIDRASKFRGQGLILEIFIPVGKKIKFDPSLMQAYNPWVVRHSENSGYNRYYGRRNYQFDWDYDSYFDWDANVDYVMTTDGKLVKPDEVIKDQKGTFEKQTDKDSLRRIIEERERLNERDRQKLDRGTDQPDDNSNREQNSSTGDQSTTKKKTAKKEQTAYLFTPFSPLII
ncbi:MAG TPA: PspC domain-containing protein [Flavitalea sp.]|nr:PspC domain-containing protein [Flavitalea sp.]